MNSSVNQVFLVSLLIIALGYLLKQKVLPAQAGSVLSKLLMYSTFPALMFDVFTKIELSPDLVLLPLIAISFGVICQLIATRLFRHHSLDPRGVLQMGSVGFNLGLFAFPLIEGIWGQAGLRYAAMFDLGNSVVVFFIGYGAGLRFSPSGGGGFSWLRLLRRILSSPPLVVLLLALAINVAKVPIPAFLSEVAGTLARANKAFVLLLMGIYLHFNFDAASLRSIRNVLLIRYGVGLLVGGALFVFLPFDPLFRGILLICLILPVGATILPFADELGYDPKLPGALTNLTMLISFVLMWALILGLGLA
jgi:malate permease and related proteins